MERISSKDSRPLWSNIQIYRPQLTSVLSIANRITGLMLSADAVVLVIWLIAAASGAEVYSRFHSLIVPWPAQILLLTNIRVFLRLCGGIRHLVWDRCDRCCFCRSPCAGSPPPIR